jgi:HEAT repeat protein
MRGPLVALTADPDSDVREQAVDNLRRFMNDPGVESQLWKMMNDPDEDVRDQVREALVKGPMSDARAAALRDRLTDVNTRWTNGCWPGAPCASATRMRPTPIGSRKSPNTQDPLARARLFSEFDEAIDRGTARDAALLPPLVQGLQDPSPLVRERAADALNDFISDPSVQQWMRYIAENDPDPAVRRQASRQLINPRR